MKLVIYGLLLIFFINLKGCACENLKLLILHNNDMHSRFEEVSKTSGTCKDKSNCYGGFARVLHVIREARKAAADGSGPPVLYLNAGDTYTGTSWFSVHKWKIAADFMNLLHPDVASFGNHDFDYGPSGILPYLQNISFPITAANVDFSGEPELSRTNVSKSHIITIQGQKIGVIGFLTPQTANIASVGRLKFLDEVKAIQEESERLNGEGVQIIIALGHSGYAMDKRIAEEVPLVDLVIGGHSHSFLWTGELPDMEKPEGPYPTYVKQITGKVVPVVQAYAYTKYMGILDVSFDEHGELVNCSGKPLLLDNTIPQHQEALDLYPKYRLKADTLIVARSKVNLDGSDESCRHKECNYGNLVTDSFINYHAARYEGKFWTDAPIAILNGGTLRGVINSEYQDGNITLSELLLTIPFVDKIVSVTLNGSSLLEALENGVRSNGETSYGEFLQISGLRYKVNWSKPVGERIIDAKARCGLCPIPVYEKIIQDKPYRILTRKFVVNGGDNFFAITRNAYDEAVEDKSMFDIIMWYAQKVSPIIIGEEGRIVVI